MHQWPGEEQGQGTCYATTRTITTASVCESTCSTTSSSSGMAYLCQKRRQRALEEAMAELRGHIGVCGLCAGEQVVMVQQAGHLGIGTLGQVLIAANVREGP